MNEETRAVHPNILVRHGKKIFSLGLFVLYAGLIAVFSYCAMLGLNNLSIVSISITYLDVLTISTLMVFFYVVLLLLPWDI